MPTYRVVAIERYDYRVIYQVEADSPAEAEEKCVRGDHDEELSHEFCEYVRYEETMSVTDANTGESFSPTITSPVLREGEVD